MSKKRSKYVERTMYPGTNLDKFLDAANAFMAEYNLQPSDVDVSVSYDDCYYENDIPNLVLRAYYI